MVEKCISKMKKGKAPGPLGVVTEMLKASSDVCSKVIADVTKSIVNGMTASLSGKIKVKIKL